MELRGREIVRNIVTVSNTHSIFRVQGHGTAQLMTHQRRDTSRSEVSSHIVLLHVVVVLFCFGFLTVEVVPLPVSLGRVQTIKK